jgi:peptide/nickel transport system substrate-binding protein
VKPWPYDPQRAKKLLADVGIVDKDGDGVLDTPDGKPFRFKLTFPNKSAVYDRMTLFMKDGYAKAGIIMDRDPVEWPLLQKKLDNRDFDAIMLGWSGTVDDDPYQMFHSSQMSDQGDNRMSYKNPELDAAIVAARTCVDDAKRLELWHQVHRILADECPYTFLLNRKATIFMNKRWQNVRTSTMGTNYNRLDFGPLPWFVPQAQQKYAR